MVPPHLLPWGVTLAPRTIALRPAPTPGHGDPCLHVTEAPPAVLAPGRRVQGREAHRRGPLHPLSGPTPATALQRVPESAVRELSSGTPSLSMATVSGKSLLMCTPQTGSRGAVRRREPSGRCGGILKPLQSARPRPPGPLDVGTPQARGSLPHGGPVLSLQAEPGLAALLPKTPWTQTGVFTNLLKQNKPRAWTQPGRRDARVRCRVSAGRGPPGGTPTSGQEEWPGPWGSHREEGRRGPKGTVPGHGARGGHCWERGQTRPGQEGHVWPCSGSSS